MLPLPISALRSARPVLGNPANRNRAVPLTYDQFRYAFANAVSEDEANHLYEQFAVPASATTLFQGAAANLNPWTDAKVDTENPERGRFSSSAARRTMPFPGRSPTRLTSARPQRERHRDRQDARPRARADNR